MIGRHPPGRGVPSDAARPFGSDGRGQGSSGTNNTHEQKCHLGQIDRMLIDAPHRAVVKPHLGERLMRAEPERPENLVAAGDERLSQQKSHTMSVVQIPRCFDRATPADGDARPIAQAASRAGGDLPAMRRSLGGEAGFPAFL